MTEQENLTGKYYAQVTEWDDSAERLIFISSLESKTIYKVMGVHTLKKNAGSTLYNVKEIRFHNYSITLCDAKLYTAKHLKECYKELPQDHVKKLADMVMNNIFNNL